MAALSKASCIGYVLQQNFSQVISVSVWDRCQHSIVWNMEATIGSESLFRRPAAMAGRNDVLTTCHLYTGSVIVHMFEDVCGREAVAGSYVMVLHGLSG